MSQVEKLIKRLKTLPKDFEWSELIKLLGYLGFDEVKRGRTSGSQRKFKNKDGKRITLHEPHPRKTLKNYQIESILKELEEEGLI